MSSVIRIDVRKNQADADALAALQQAKGFQSSVERSMFAIWNWSPAVTEPDVVASDSDGELFVVITRVP